MKLLPLWVLPLLLASGCASYGVVQNQPLAPSGAAKRYSIRARAAQHKGGRFTAASYGLYGERIFEDYENGFLRRDLEGALLRALYLAGVMSPTESGQVRHMNMGFCKISVATTLAQPLNYAGAKHNMRATLGSARRSHVGGIMRKVLRIATCVLAALYVLATGIGTSSAQPTFTSEDVSFDAATARDAGASVRGTLRLPEGALGRLPAVLVLHTGAGARHDYHSDAFSDVLNRAGIATLWIEMFVDSAARPSSTREVLPLTYGSLVYLAGHAHIDPKRIGVLGFSYGGVVALIMASQEVTQEYTGGKARFAAHLSLYPVCWIHQQVLSGSNTAYGASTYQRFTGAPVHILAGEKDDYDEPDSCPKFVAALPEDARKHVAVTVYPGAGHSFDAALPTREEYSSFAHAGRGGTVTLGYDAAAAARALAFAVEFFSKNLAVKP